MFTVSHLVIVCLCTAAMKRFSDLSSKPWVAHNCDVDVVVSDTERKHVAVVILNCPDSLSFTSSIYIESSDHTENCYKIESLSSQETR